MASERISSEGDRGTKRVGGISFFSSFFFPLSFFFRGKWGLPNQLVADLFIPSTGWRTVRGGCAGAPWVEEGAEVLPSG